MLIMKKKYNAIDIANYIINKSIEIGEPINNLKLQKLLYFSQIEYFCKNNKWLFNDNITATDYGPKVKSVYDTFLRYAALNITMKREENISFPKDVTEILDHVVTKYKKCSAFDLVEITKNTSPFTKHYAPNYEAIILKESIAEYCIEYIKEDN